MQNTGYKSFETLEKYFTDNETSTGETKPNVVTDPDYIAPVQDFAECPPTERYYNTVQTKEVTKNDCGTGYTGSTVTATAYANQFVSNVSVTDANNKAIAWLEETAQNYANYKGTCTIVKAGSITNLSTNTIAATYMSIQANNDSIVYITLPSLAPGEIFNFDTSYTNILSSGDTFVLNLYTPVQNISSSNYFYMSPRQNSSDGYFSKGSSAWTATVTLNTLQPNIDIIIR